MKPKVISLVSLALLVSLWLGGVATARQSVRVAFAKISAALSPAAQAAQTVPRTRENFDIRAGMQRTLNDPAEANYNTALAGNARAQLRRSELPYVLRRAHPTVQMKWSSLTQAPSRVWSFSEFLSAPSNDDTEVIARRFLRDNADLLRLSADEIAALSVARRYQDAHNGLTHVTLQQQIDGIEVFQAELAVHVARNGAVIALNGEALPTVATLANARAPKLSAAAALRLAAEEAEAKLNDALVVKTPPAGAEQKQLFERANNFARDVEARLVYFPLSSEQVRLAWQFILWMQETPDVYLTLIDAEKGSLLFRHNLTCYDENPLRPHGLVFTKDAPISSVPFTNPNPPLVEREDLPFRATPFNGADIFPLSDPHYDWWAGRPGNNLVSNNTDTHLDRDANNQPDLPRLEAADGNFSFPLDFTKQPTDPDYQKAAQVNLFYWINRYHDILYSFGFTEAAGNFQTDNFGRGGRGADAVLGDAQDGAGTNNANFSTPPDGNPGRVQMFLWTRTNPQRDGDFDQGIIIHELTHGLTNRLVGNATGLTALQSGGMGEGWSDYFGLVLLRNENDDLKGAYPLAQYVLNNFAIGLRRYPYSTQMDVFPLTYKDIRLNTEVHRIGEIWCNALLEVRAALIQRYGFREGQRQSIQLVVDGLKLTPRAPSFVDARNAILLADRVNNNGANQCLLWQAFSKRGLGPNAESQDGNDTAPLEALETAAYCNALGSVRTDRTHYVSGETLRVNVGDANATGTLSVRLTSSVTGDSETLMLTPDSNQRGSYDGQLRLASGRARPGDGLLQGSVEAGDQIIVSYTDANTGGGGTAQARATVAFAREKAVFDDLIEFGNQGWLPAGQWAVTNTRAASPLRSWTDSPAGNYANGTNAALTSPLFDLSGLSDITLSFAHSYDLEASFDFGLVEFSLDDGQSWRRAAAFTGAQAAFRQAQVRLRGLDNQPRARVRFRLTSDASVVADGWYIDDIRLTGRSVSPTVITPGTLLQPAIASVIPAFGATSGNTRVTIYGANFTESEDTVVTFAGAPATGVTVVSPFVLTALTPAHEAAVVNVRVSNRNGAVALGQGFTYYTLGNASPQLRLTNLYPDFGSTRGGTVVTLLGESFSPETQVTFDGRAANVTYVNPNTLRAVTPFAPTAGRVNVVVRHGAVTGSNAANTGTFNYINPSPPLVDVVSPDGGEAFFVGSTVNLRWNASDNVAVASQRISLFRPGAFTQQFVSDLAVNLSGNARNFNWAIPATLANGEYLIRVIAADNEGTETEAYSAGRFSIGRRWETSQPLPAILTRHGLASDGRYLYAVGGVSTTGFLARTLRFDTTAPAAWTDLAALPAALHSGEAAFLRGKLFLPGGINASNQVVATHYTYDSATNTWATSAAIPNPTYLYAAVVDTARGVYYRVGGGVITAAPSGSTALTAYNPDTNTWTSLPPMQTGRSAHEAALIEGKLYVAGGFGQTTADALTSVEVFDFDTRRWSELAPLNRARAFGVNFVTRDEAGNLYWVLVGGQDAATGALLGPEVYDLRRNRWIITDNSLQLPTPRTGLAGAVAGNFFYAVGANSTATGLTVERIRTEPLAPIPLNPVPPVLVVPETQVALPNVELQFSVLANDLASGVPLAIHAAGLPSGATFNTSLTTNNSTHGLFRWTPTSADVGRTFTLTFTVNDGLALETKLVNLHVVAARPLAAVNAADFRSGALAPDSIAAIFGSELAVRTETAVEQPLPLDLSGTTVTVNGVRAQLFFVSPTQINFAVPASINLGQPGPATIVVSNPAGIYSVGTVQVAPSAPALFTRDQSGRGEAIAVATVDGIRFQTAPFDVLVNGRPNILVLFGTGLRRALAVNPNDEDGVAEAVSVTIGGRPARVLFAGAQGGFTGFDQINVEIPASLAGGGQRSVEVALAVNGENANRVLIEIK